MKGKLILIMLAFTAAFTSAKAQTAYAGGAGDGYAMAELTGVYLGIPQLAQPNLAISPNPVRTGGSIHISPIKSFSGMATLQLLDIAGRLVLTKEVAIQNEWDMSLAGVPAGAYVLKISTPAGMAYTKLIMEP